MPSKDGGGGGGISGWADLSLPGWLTNLQTLANNPRRFVLGVVLSAVAGAVLQAYLLGLNLTQYLAGFQIPGTIVVDGNTVDVPWCNGSSCNLFSFVDIPEYLYATLTDALSPAGIQFLQGLEQVWLGLPNDGGLAGPVVLFLLGIGSVVGLVWVVRILIAVAPISKP